MLHYDISGSHLFSYLLVSPVEPSVNRGLNVGEERTQHGADYFLLVRLLPPAALVSGISPSVLSVTRQLNGAAEETSHTVPHISSSPAAVTREIVSLSSPGRD
ncbi:hypothetical protein GDO81_006372 [Engystomops pustulosus]|uniref:Uncharacterized protein n=1 Tax=Engystomops pustulosus TaxID=76066 RepID=A0AAV7CY67_ENGPU|nr:hypothetical protein GDO81_006372 [Engystomops pustulosus]